MPNLKRKKLLHTALTTLLALSFVCPANAYSKYDEIDSIRAELACSRNKTSASYASNVSRLRQLIKQSNIDYSTKGRLKDVERLIKEKKYDSANYELHDLISNDTEVVKCYILLGDICLLNNNVKKACENYMNAISYDSHSSLALFKLSKLYFDLNKNDIALDYLKQAVEYTSDKTLLREIEALVQSKITPLNKLEASYLYEILGLIYAKGDNKTVTYSAFEKSLQLNPNDLYLKYYLGDMFYLDNENKNAIIVYDSILNEIPSESQIRASKAKILTKEGYYDLAKEEYDKILVQYPASMQAKYGLYKIFENKLTPEKILLKLNSNVSNYKVTYSEYISFAKFLEAIGDKAGAENFFEAARKLEESQRALKEQQKASKSHKSQIKESQKTEKQSKKSAEVKLKEARQIQEKIEAKKQSLDALEKNIERPQTPPQVSEADTVIQQYLDIVPKTAQVYLAIANAYKLKNDTQGAIYYYYEALKLNPSDSDINYYLGLAYFELNQFENARIYLLKSLKADSQNEKSQNLLVFVNQRIITNILNEAYTLYESGDYIEAFDNLDKAIKKFPNNAQLYYYRSLICDAMNRNAAQIIDLQKSIQIDPSYYMAYYQLGRAYEKIGDEKSALVQYERFLSIEPDEKNLVEEVQRKVIELGSKYY